MKGILSFILLCLLPVAALRAATLGSDAAYDRLAALGFENVKVAKEGQSLYVCLEDNHYRGTYRGLGIALQALLIDPDETATGRPEALAGSATATSPAKSAEGGAEADAAPTVNQRAGTPADAGIRPGRPHAGTSAAEADTIVLVALENGLAQVTLRATHSSAVGWTVRGEHGGHDALLHLRSARRQAPSAGKVDLVVSPHVVMTNYIYTQAWEAAIDLTPSLEVSLWKGAKLTAGVALPLWNNFVRDASMGCVRPGLMTLSQDLLSTRRLALTLTGGVFTQSRCGIDVRGAWHVTPALDLGFIYGYTGGWYVSGRQWNFCELDRHNILATARYYERHSGVEVGIEAGQFVYGDAGARLNLSRRMAEYDIGIYGTLTDGDRDAGFFLAIPMGARRMGRHRAFRVRLPETVAWEQNMRNYSSYLYHHRGVMYLTRAGGDVGGHYWNPDYVATAVMRLLESKTK